MIDTALIAEKLKEFGYQQRYLDRKIGWLMSFDRDIRQWKCGKAGVVNLQKVSSIVRDIGEPCLHQSSIKVVITINKMLKPDKWQATFDGDGKVSGFQKVLKLIILGIFLASVYLRLGTKQQSKTCDGGFCSHQDGFVAFQGFATASESCGTVSVYVNQAVFSSDDCVEQFAPANNSFENGVDPSIRPEVWEFLLGCYALSSTAEYRRQLRTARRERYTELIKQCQTMHSSIGTGSLAYVVGSKVMDMRTSSKDEGKREAEVQSRQASDVDTNKPDSYTNGNNNCTDTSHAYKRESSSDSGDLLSVRGSLIGAAYDSSCFLPASPISVHYKCSSPNPVKETFGSNFQAENYFDFPPLPVTDLFEKRKKDKKGCRSFDGGLSTRRRLRFGDEHMHSFRISNNADLVVESNHSAPDDILRCSNSESDVCWDGHNPVSWSENLVYETEMLNKLRISDAPETPPINAATSQGGTVSEDRVSEWLWTLHRIVVDVVRTDSHLEFYEDTKNLARMSDILAVYAWVDPRTGYCQGMSDLLSPFVVLFEDNADAFWCFEMLLRRMRENFQMEGPTGVMKQLQGLWHILELTDKEMFSHLSLIGAESLHFAFRMLLVLFRRELSFNEALSMWEMMWAADFDESLSCHLDDNCPELLVIQIPRDSRAEMEQESIDNSPSCLKGGASSKKGHLEHSVSDNTGVKSASAHPFCGLAKTFWSRNDRLHVGTALSTMGNGDDELPVFCVAAILIMNRQKITRETHSIDDLIKIFNDNLLKIRVKRCIHTAIKLRKKYFYKLIKSRSPAAQSVD